MIVEGFCLRELQRVSSTRPDFHLICVACCFLIDRFQINPVIPDGNMFIVLAGTEPGIFAERKDINSMNAKRNYAEQVEAGAEK